MALFFTSSIEPSSLYFVKILFILFFISSCSYRNWSEASRESVGIAPKAQDLKEDIIQVYYARAYGWRGTFGVHPWVAWKKKEEDQYTVAQVTAWNIRREGNAISVKKDLPDRKWFDKDPTLMLDLRGEKARKAIAKVEALIAEYPYKKTYRVWPGPNSNTFVSYLLRNVEELNLELPAHAIGKDYLPNNIFATTASNTGFVFSVFGLLGFTLGVEEGIEINLLGLHLGLDLWTPALKLPLVGRLGFPDKAID